MPNTYRLRPKALQDLEDIWNYSAETWGIDQAEAYIRDLDQAFALLANHPGLGVRCDDIREGYRKHHIGRHFVFYMELAGYIDIVRILHDRMDIETRMSDE